jgi:hypothetical protein
MTARTQTFRTVVATTPARRITRRTWRTRDHRRQYWVGVANYHRAVAADRFEGNDRCRRALMADAATRDPHRARGLCVHDGVTPEPHPREDLTASRRVVIFDPRCCDFCKGSSCRPCWRPPQCWRLPVPRMRMQDTAAVRVQQRLTASATVHRAMRCTTVPHSTTPSAIRQRRSKPQSASRRGRAPPQMRRRRPAATTAYQRRMPAAVRSPVIPPSAYRLRARWRNSRSCASCRIPPSAPCTAAAPAEPNALPDWADQSRA